jgi:hypothetical protein
MTLLPRCVAIVSWAAFVVAPVFAQQRADVVPSTTFSASQAAPSVSSRPWFFRHYGIGTFGSPLGIGGRVAVSLTDSLNLRAGASYFNFNLSRTADSIPYTAHVRLESEQAQLDWYPFHGKFHVSPGVLFGNSNRLYGDALVPAGNSFTLNGVNYYSGGGDPIHASGFLRFARTSPTLTVGWGNWVRHPEQRWGRGHWTFPFEAGVAFSGDPKTALNFSGTVCTDSAQHFCQNIATDAPVQNNVNAERRKLQNDANWARFYPIVAGGVVYRF